jgi:hypothetical protein
MMSTTHIPATYRRGNASASITSPITSAGARHQVVRPSHTANTASSRNSNNTVCDTPSILASNRVARCRHISVLPARCLCAIPTERRAPIVAAACSVSNMRVIYFADEFPSKNSGTSTTGGSGSDVVALPNVISDGTLVNRGRPDAVSASLHGCKVRRTRRAVFSTAYSHANCSGGGGPPDAGPPNTPAHVPPAEGDGPTGDGGTSCAQAQRSPTRRSGRTHPAAGVQMSAHCIAPQDITSGRAARRVPLQHGIDERSQFGAGGSTAGRQASGT